MSTATAPAVIESERVGPIVYSIRVDQQTGEAFDPYAICDHCGWTDTELFVEVFDNRAEPVWGHDYTARIRLDLMTEHHCHV